MNKQISSAELFSAFFTVRLFSLLINLKTVGETAICFALSVLLFIVFDALKSGINKSRAAKALLGVVCIVLAIQTLFSYTAFVSNAVHPDFNGALLAALVVTAVLYASFLRLPAVMRFSLFSAAMLVIALATAVFANIKSVEVNNINAVVFKPDGSVLNYLKCFDIPVLYALINKPELKNSAVCAILFSNLTALILLMFIYFVTGSAVMYYSYPSFTLFQLSRIGSLSRLDIVFTGSMLLAIFLKCSVLTSLGIGKIKGDKNEKTY